MLRLRKYLEAKGWWDADQEKAQVAVEKKAVLSALTAVNTLFSVLSGDGSTGCLMLW